MKPPMEQRAEVRCPLCPAVLEVADTPYDQRHALRQHLVHRHYSLTRREVALLVADVGNGGEST